MKEIVTQDELDLLLEEAGDKLVVVDFWASWCGPCKLIGPELDRLAASPDYSKTVVFAKVDVDEAYDLAQETGIECMPTIIFYKNKERIEDLCGANKAMLNEMLERYA